MVHHVLVTSKPDTIYVIYIGYQLETMLISIMRDEEALERKISKVNF